MTNDRIWNLMAKKLSGEASAGELRELEFSLRQDPDLHYSLEAMQDMWKNPSHTEPEQAEIAYQNHLERMRSLGIYSNASNNDLSEFDTVPVKRPLLTRWKTIAFPVFGLLVLVLCFYFFEPRNPVPLAQKPVWEVVTRNGTKTSLLLPDGSTVWLNAGSRLTYDSLYGNTIREVTLSGEAYFDVVKNVKKPFIIHTGKINIKVLGTTFNVKSYPGEKTIETSLIKGSIEVTFPSSPSKKIILKPNQKLVINKMESVLKVNGNVPVTETLPTITVQRLNRIGTDSVIAETGWMQNRLYFNDMSFYEILKSMERKYGVTFQLVDSSLDNIHFTGSFQNETVTQALDALRLTAEMSTEDFTYQIQDNRVFIYNNKTSIRSIQPK